MRVFHAAVLVTVLVGVLGATVGVGVASAQVPKTLKEFGEPVYPVFEGWYRNPDGTATILLGFFNQNLEQTVDLPVGELNRFSPGPEDRGQPTHFPPGRSWGVMTIQVPGDFDGGLTWTLTGNDQPASAPFHLEAPYYVEPLKDAANNNEPPTIWFPQGGDRFTGPPVGTAHTITARVGAPVELTVWLSDVTPDTHVRESPFRRRPPMHLRWSVLRGPGAVEFTDPEHEFAETTEQTATTTATFHAPGEYWLRAEALDTTGEGGGGFQCCWTSAIVQATVSR